MIELARIIYLSAEAPNGGLSNVERAHSVEADGVNIGRIVLDTDRRLALIEHRHNGLLLVVPLEKVTLCYAARSVTLSTFLSPL